MVASGRRCEGGGGAYRAADSVERGANPLALVDVGEEGEGFWGLGPGMDWMDWMDRDGPGWFLVRWGGFEEDGGTGGGTHNTMRQERQRLSVLSGHVSRGWLQSGQFSGATSGYGTNQR
jgi:hypothetical protein